MAKGRIRSRKELREQYDAAEARERETKPDDDAEEDVGDLDAESSDDDAAEKAAPAKKKAVKKKAEPKTRKKAVKVVRKRVVWIVFDNSNKQVARFDYNRKDEAYAKMEQLKTEKKQTYFVQPIKEEITE